MEREREIQKARSTPTEDLFGQMVLSMFRKNWHFNEFQLVELARRLGGLTATSIIGTSDLLIKASASVGYAAVKVIR